MMKAARTSEMLVNFYPTTWCYNPEDSHLHTHHRENKKSYSVCFIFVHFTHLIKKILKITKEKGNKFSHH
jgi:hypothetical protein